MQIFVARQPIFNNSKKIFAYELLFRDGLENAFPDIDGDIATSNLLSHTFFSFDLKEVLAGKVGFINFTRNLLLQKIPVLFSQYQIIVEILEDIEPDQEILNAVRQLHKNGITLALDDFVFHEKYKPLMEYCKVIKFDLTLSTLEEIQQAIDQIPRKEKMVLLAEKVETYEEFNAAKDMGFELFQGYFFAKPEILSKKDISASYRTKMSIASEFFKPTPDNTKINELIRQDLAISYKLMKYINAAYFKRQVPIDTIKEAITFLGFEEFRKFICIVLVSNLCEQKPSELIRTSFIRARMLEQCKASFRIEFTSDELFVIGLFSLMAAILDSSMEKIVNIIGFSEKMQQALLGQNKRINALLRIIGSYEKGDWNSKSFSSIEKSSFLIKLPEIYMDAVRMANSLLVEVL